MNQGRRPFGEAEREHLVRLYDGNLAFADQEVGALRAGARDARACWEKTVVIVAADHGEELFEHGWIGHNVHVYEPSVHVPLDRPLPEGHGPGGRAGERRSRTSSTSRRRSPTSSACAARAAPTASSRAAACCRVALGAPGKPAVLSRTVWDRPRYALRDERFKFLYDTRTGEERLVRPRGRPGRGARTSRASGRCARRTTARRSTTGRWGWRAGGTRRASRRRSAHVRAVREPEGARLHPGRLQVAGRPKGAGGGRRAGRWPAAKRRARWPAAQRPVGRLPAFRFGSPISSPRSF